MKIKPPFTIEWEYGPNKKAQRLGGRCVFGFLYNATGRVILSFIWFHRQLH